MDLSGYITSSEARLQEVERAISAFDFTKGDQNQYQQLNREPAFKPALSYQAFA